MAHPPCIVEEDGFETIYVDSQVGIQHNKLVTFFMIF